MRREYAALAATESASDYGFDAVAAYTLRWSLLAQWLDFNVPRAAQRLTELLETVLTRAEPLHAH